jgi:hypothetical protein
MMCFYPAFALRATAAAGIVFVLAARQTGANLKSLCFDRVKPCAIN